MSRIRFAVIVLSLCLAAAASALTPAITRISPTALPLTGGPISVQTTGWATSECGSICNLDVYIGGEKLPREAIYFFGLTLSVNVPPQTKAGYARFELHHPYGPPAIVENAILFYDPNDVETVLLPVTVARDTKIPGAFGSLWTATTTVVNGSDQRFDISVPWGDPRLLVSPPLPQYVTVEPYDTAYLDLALSGPLLVRIPRVFAEKISFQTRVHDESRATTNFGTHVPSVRERDFYTTRLMIADVPTAEPFRSTLRIYSTDGPPRGFLVTVYSQPRMLLSPYPRPNPPFPIQLTELRANTAKSMELPYIPPVAEILLPALDSGPVQILVQPVDDGIAPYYALVSVTNNETQHVTILTPR